MIMCGVKGVARSDGPSHDSLAEVFYVARNCFLQPTAVLFFVSVSPLSSTSVFTRSCQLFSGENYQKNREKVEKKKLALRSWHTFSC